MIKALAFAYIAICLAQAMPALAQSLDGNGALENKPFGSIIDNALDRAEQGFGSESGDAPEDAETETLKDIVIGPSQPEIESLETKIIPLLHAEASTIVEALSELKSIDGEVLYNEDDKTLILKDFKEHLNIMAAYVQEVDIVLETKNFQLEYIEVDDILLKVKGLLSGKVGQIQIDRLNNSIVVTDAPPKMGQIEELIAGMDALNKEIRIEAKILQIVLNDEHIDGVDWEAIVGEYRDVPFGGFHRQANGDEAGKLDIGSVTSEDYDILLEALDTVGVVSDVSNEILIAENEGNTTIQIMSSLLHEIQKPHSNPEINGSLKNDERVDFHITPVIKRGDAISVRIRPEHQNGQKRQEEAKESEIQIANGETIVIGSLFKDVMVESTWKIPLLGDIPILGFVFRSQGERPRKSEIITFLTVKAISLNGNSDEQGK